MSGVITRMSVQVAASRAKPATVAPAHSRTRSACTLNTAHVPSTEGMDAARLLASSKSRVVVGVARTASRLRLVFSPMIL